MIRLTALLLQLACATQSFAQRLPESNRTDQNISNPYLQRSRYQKTAAWLMLGGGTALAVFGIQKAVNAPVIIPNGTGKEGETGAILFFAGAGTVLGSIPLFIASGRNKRKGLSMSVNREQSFVPDPARRNSFVALQLRIGL
jgi:hypothetical protein